MEVRPSLAALPLRIYVEGSGITSIHRPVQAGHLIYAQRRMLLSNQEGGANLRHVKVLCIECGVHLTDKVSVSASDEASWLLFLCKKVLCRWRHLF